MDSYIDSDSRWEAYQFSDPYAANSFVCAVKKTDIVCRPSCDHHPKVAAREEIVFLDSINQALKAGYVPCKHCDPVTPKSGAEIELIKSTIVAINYSIGFTSAQNESKKRAFSTPSVNTADGHLDNRQSTRNESEHVKLVELACRHIAAAAAESLSKQDDEPGSKKKRRGGVLGFKELAAKSKLSPWHFHRVFKSVTSLTPKSYGDQCWKHMKACERPTMTKQQRTHFRSNSDITNNYHKSKRVKREESIAPNTVTIPSSTQSSVSIDLTPIIPCSDPLTLNTNSLDINAPTRHHSLDLGSVGLDSFDLNNVSSLLPDFVPVSQMPPNGIATQMPTSLDFQLQVQQQMASMQEMPEFTQPELQGSVSRGESETSTLGLYNPESHGQWPSIDSGSVTPPQYSSRLLTPPSSVSDPVSDGFYNTYTNSNNSPLDNDVFFNMNGSMTQPSGSYEFLSTEMQDPGFLFVNDHAAAHELFSDKLNGGSASNANSVDLLV